MLLQVAHHRLFEFMGAGARGAGNHEHRPLPSQPPHDFLGSPLGFLGLQQIDFIDEQPTLLGGKIRGEFLEFRDDGARVPHGVGLRVLAERYR